jgi:cytochrome P450
MATWFTMCVLRSANGLSEYRKETQKYLIQEHERPEYELRFDMPALKRSQYVQGVWKEALRTGSASVAARVVVKDSEIEGYVVNKGSVVMIPVHLLHFDKDVFQDPDTIDPMRWAVSDGASAADHEQIRKQNANLRSFGGGTGLCSGRFVAEQEIISVVSTVLLLFDLEFVTPTEKFELNPRSIGIMSPKVDPVVRLRRRELSF